METLRRATLYAQQRAAIANDLLFRLEANTREHPKDALAAFDFGYLTECYKQASWLRQHTDALKSSEGADTARANAPMKTMDGYEWVRKAIALRGTDPQLRETFVILSAHYDHLGLAASGDDRIYNGANDDGSGTSSVIEVAAALAAMPVHPKRSVFAFTATSSR